MALADVTQIQVNLATQPITQQGFGTLLIAGTTAPIAAIAEGAVAEYGSMLELDEAGWMGTEDEYAAAGDAFAQGIARVKIAHLSAFTARVLTVTFTDAADTTRTVRVTDPLGRDVIVSDPSTGETVTQIRDAFLALLQATLFETEGLVTFAASGADAITATGDNLGYFFDIDITAGDATFNVAESTPGQSYQGALAALTLLDDDWYGLVGVDDEAYHIASRAAFAESRKKSHLYRTSEAGVIVPATDTDIMSLLEGTYRRTLGLYHETAGEYVDAALAAKVLKVDIDTQATTYAGQQLAGITQQRLTTGEQNAVESKNGNYYSPLDNARGASYPGKAASGDWFDLILSADWLEARASEELRKVWSDRANAGKKIPYTNHGIGLIENAIRGVVARGITIGHLAAGTPKSETDPEPIFTFPTRAECAPADVANRIYRFQVQVGAAGAIINMVGTITLVT